MVLTKHGYPPIGLLRSATEPFPRQRGAGPAQRAAAPGNAQDTPAGPHAPGGTFQPLKNHPPRHSFGEELLRTCPGLYGRERASLYHAQDKSRAFSVQNEHHLVYAGDSQQFVQPPAVGFPACAQLNCRYQSQI